MACPVCISSTCPLSVPVEAHWATNCFCERLGDDGRDDQREGHREEGDEGQQRADGEHHEEHADDGQEGGDELGQALLERLADVVDVVGDAAQQVTPRMAVEVAQRQPAELPVDLLAQPVDGALRDAGHDAGLRPGEDRAQDVDAGQLEQHRRERGRVQAAAARDTGPRRRRWSPRPGAWARGWRRTRCRRRAIMTSTMRERLRAQLAQQPAERGPEVLRPWPRACPCPCPSCPGRHRGRPPGRLAPPGRPGASPAGRSCRGLFPGQLRVDDLLVGLVGRQQLARGCRCRPPGRRP